MSPDNSEKNGRKTVRISRRNVLKNVGGLAAVSSVATTASASTGVSHSDKGVNKGATRLIDLKISAEVKPSVEEKLVTGRGCSLLPSYYLDEGRAFLVSSGLNGLTNNPTHVRTPSEIVGTSDDSITTEIPFTLECDHNGYTMQTFEVAGRTSAYDFDIYIEENKTVVKRESEEVVSASIGRTETKELDHMRARTQIYEDDEVDNPRDTGPSTIVRKKKVDEGEISINPLITVQDHGKTPLFSTAHHRIFPRSMSGANLLLKRAENSDRYEAVEHNSNIVTTREVDN